jgi:hypothetical protein
VFSQKPLAAPIFALWTHWRAALGRSALGRVYCVIIDVTDAGFNEPLVAGDLARILRRVMLFAPNDSRSTDRKKTLAHVFTRP